jgi:uncharacterized membrane protein YagU involved in acid resistance
MTSTWTTSRSLLRRPAAAGAVAGVAGGLVFGAAMASLGTMATVASIVRTDSAAVGFGVHLMVSAVLGAGFGLLVAHQRAQAGDALFWGLVYGAFWWFLGPLTLQPLLVGRPVAWDLTGAQALLPSLFGHLFYGATTAVVLAGLRRARGPVAAPQIATAVRGLVAGVAVAMLYVGLDVLADAGLGLLLGIGALAGLGYPALFGARREAAGPAIVRGTAYGFLCWMVAGLTLPPLLRNGRLDWSRESVSAAVHQLAPYLLLGAGIAVVFTGLGAVARWLFIDDVRMLPVESAGSRGLRATGYGALAGLAGGLAFTVVMVLVDALPTVAGLVGARSVGAGLVVHLIIAQLIGVSYAIMFRRCSFDVASGLGWGVSYGVLWWVLGNQTLLPVLTGRPPGWTVGELSAGFPSLVGHLAYGAALGVGYFLLEDRTNPWWFTRNEIERERAAVRREAVLGSAPALWGFIVLIALTIPLVIGG